MLHTAPQSQVAPLSKDIAADMEEWSPEMVSGRLGITKQYVREYMVACGHAFPVGRKSEDSLGGRIPASQGRMVRAKGTAEKLLLPSVPS